MTNSSDYSFQCDILDRNTGRAIIVNYECIVVVEDFDRVANTIDVFEVYSTDGLRLLDGGELAQMIRREVISQAKDDEWLRERVFARNEDDDASGVWAKADAQYAARAGK